MTLRFSLTFYILSALSCLLVLTWLLLSLIWFKTSENDLIALKRDAGKLQLGAIVELLPRPLGLPGPATPAGKYLALLDSDKSFGGLTVIDQTARPVLKISDQGEPDAPLITALHTAHESSQISPDGQFLRFNTPITENGTVIGAARLTVSLAAEQERLKTSRRLMLCYFVLDFLLLLLLGSYLLSRSVVTPIRRLVSMTRRIEAGDLSGLVHVPGSSEVSELCHAYNTMVLALGRKREEVEEKVASLNQANQEILEARNETIRSEKMASVGLLAAGMAHEIGTPLAAIMGYTGILSDELAEDPEKADYLRRIAEESHRIDRIVRGLLDYARPKGVLQEEVDLKELIEKTVELLQAQGALKFLRVRVEVDTKVPRFAADPHQLQQVLINLIMNARDAMPKGGDLWLKGGLDGDEVLVEVIDNGEGMPPEQLSRVFDPFFTTKEPGKGTGLGLAIVARIAESCGGRITVQSALGKGSRFVYRIPVRGASAVPVPGREQNSSTREGA